MQMKKKEELAAQLMQSMSFMSSVLIGVLLRSKGYYKTQWVLPSFHKFISERDVDRRLAKFTW